MAKASCSLLPHYLNLLTKSNPTAIDKLACPLLKRLVFQVPTLGKKEKKQLRFIQRYIIKIRFLPKKMLVLASISLKWASDTTALFISSFFLSFFDQKTAICLCVQNLV